MTVETARAAQGAVDRASMIARINGKQPMSDTFDIVLEEAPQVALRAAQDALSRAELYGGDDLPAARAALTEAERAAADAVQRLHLRGLRRPAYEALQLAHPPTPAQKEQGQVYNADTFAVALCALVVVDPGDRSDCPGCSTLTVPHQAHLLNPADVQGWFDSWNQGEVGALWSAAIGVCTQSRNSHLPKG